MTKTTKKKVARVGGSARPAKQRATASTAFQSLGPIEVSAHEWLYVEQQGLCVVHQVTNAAKAVVKTDLFYLPWPILRCALAMHDKKRQPRKARK